MFPNRKFHDSDPSQLCLAAPRDSLLASPQEKFRKNGAKGDILRHDRAAGLRRAQSSRVLTGGLPDVKLLKRIRQ